MNLFHERPLVRDVLVATLAVFGLYALGQGVQSLPFVVPYYLLVVGFDVLETIFGPVGAHFHVVFGAYLVGLGVIAGLGAGLVRRRAADSSISGWRFGVAGAFGVVGIFSLAFALLSLARSTQWAPVLITGTTGIVALGLAGWLAGVLDGV